MSAEALENLKAKNVNEAIATKLSEIIGEGKLGEDQLDDRALEAIGEFTPEDAVKILEQFAKNDLEHVTNKSAFLCGVMKTYRASMNNPAPEEAEVSTAGPNEEKVKALLERTGYSLDISTSQRKYGGPPPGWEGPAPGTGTEKFCSQIFIGKLARDVYEDEVVPLFEEFGTIYEFRVMVDPTSGLNKGYGFCQYTTKESAQKAMKEMNGKEFKGKKLGVVLSSPNNRLFIGSIPKSKTKQEILDEVKTQVDDLTDVIIYPDVADTTKNRGFAFLEFTTHKEAADARRKLMGGKCKIFGSSNLPVDWAEPQPEIDDETMAKVKVVYVKNITTDTTEEKLEELFKQYGELEKVKKIKDYAFVHFMERDNAVTAIEELNNQELDGRKIDVSLAKPQVQTLKKRGGLQGGRGGRGGGRGARGGAAAGYDDGYGGYGGGYGGGWYDEGYGYGGGYGDYYASPMRARGGFRGGPRGAPRGGPRGGPMMRGGPMRGRGGMHPGMRGGPRGGMRGGPRGAPRGGPRGAPRGGPAGQKRRGGQEGWGSAPAHKPVKQEAWYSDDYGASW